MHTKNRSVAVLFLLIFFAINSTLIASEFNVSSLWDVQMDAGETVFDGLVVDHNLIVHSSDGFKAYNASGENKWMYHYPAGSYTIGMPVIEDDIAVFVIYTGKDGKGTSTSSDALLNALDLKTGNLLWSAYLPQYLPLDYKILDGNLFVSCQYIKKPLKKKHVVKRWESDFQRRRDTWLMCIDVLDGRQKWYQQVDGWIQAISSNDKTAYFQEYGSTVDGSYTVITSRNFEDGSIVWTSDRIREELRFLSSYKQVDGNIFIADKKLVLINHEDGSILRQMDMNVGSYTIKNGILWNITYKGDEGFFQQKVDLKDFAEIEELNISGSMEDYREWTRKKDFEKKMEEDLAYWYKYHNLSNESSYYSYLANRKTDKERLYLPVASSHNMHNDADICDFYGSYFLLKLYNGIDTNMGAFLLAEQPELKVKMSGEANQQPVGLFDRKSNSLFVAYDNLFVRVEREGVMNVVAENLNGLAQDMFMIGEKICVVDNGGAWAFGVKEEEPEIEKPVDPEPEAPVALEPIPEPVKEEVVVPSEPEFKEVTKEIDGWRIQIMYLTKTTLSKATEYAKQAERKTGHPVYVIQDGAIKLRVGDFKTETDARKALIQVKNTGFSDAYLVKSKIVVKEMVQIN